MNTKTCLYCGETFTPKRADALCCSSKCRSAFNYKKKQRKNDNLNLPTIGDEAQILEKGIVVKGEVDTTFLIKKTNECETKMEVINTEIAQLETSQINLSAHTKDLLSQILTIESGDKAKLLKRYNLSDLTLYNNYLNGAFLSEKKNGNNFANNRLKSESDLENKFNPMLRVEIEDYRNNIGSAIDKHDLEIANNQHQIDTAKSEIDKNCAKIKELQNQLRFYEARVLKYETILLSV